jgi:hypothetical protein
VVIVGRREFPYARGLYTVVRADAAANKHPAIQETKKNGGVQNLTDSERGV